MTNITNCDKCNCALNGVGKYSLDYNGVKYWVCGSCMHEIIKKELLVSKVNDVNELERFINFLKDDQKSNLEVENCIVLYLKRDSANKIIKLYDDLVKRKYVERE